MQEPTAGDIRRRILEALEEPEREDWLDEACRCIERWKNVARAKKTYDIDTIAHRLKAARTARGMSQRELAARVGTYQGTYARWERGHAMPAKKLFPICMSLGISIHWLLNGGPDPCAEKLGIFRKVLDGKKIERKLQKRKRAEVVKKIREMNELRRGIKRYEPGTNVVEGHENGEAWNSSVADFSPGGNYRTSGV